MSWSPPEDDEQEFNESEVDELEEAMMNCHQFVGRDGFLYCGAIGSEDCDECPFQCDLGCRVPREGLER